MVGAEGAILKINVPRSLERAIPNAYKLLYIASYINHLKFTFTYSKKLNITSVRRDYLRKSSGYISPAMV